MPRIEPHLIPVVTDLARGLRDLDVPFAIVGALVPELLLGVRPAQMTNDADAAVVVQSTADFETLASTRSPATGSLTSFGAPPSSSTCRTLRRSRRRP